MHGVAAVGIEDPAEIVGQAQGRFAGGADRAGNVEAGKRHGAKNARCKNLPRLADRRGVRQHVGHLERHVRRPYGRHKGPHLVEIARTGLFDEDRLAALDRLARVDRVVAVPALDEREPDTRLIEQFRRRGEDGKAIALADDPGEIRVRVEAADEPHIRLCRKQIVTRWQVRMGAADEGDADFC
jgi:hypothetical protein